MIEFNDSQEINLKRVQQEFSAKSFFSIMSKKLSKCDFSSH